MKPNLSFRAYFLLAISIGAQTMHAHSANATNLTGMYTHRDVDSQTQLVLLDDNTFCLTFIGGELDLIKTGSWKLVDSQTIQLQEVKKTETRHPAIAKNIDRLGPMMVGINFDGYTLSHAYSPVFATSATDTLPSTFRPLFPSHTESWSLNYALPLMSAEQVRYFYIGDVEMGSRGPTQRLRVTQYKLEGYDTVRIGFNYEQAERPLNIKAHVTATTVVLDDNTTLGHKTELTPELVAEVRKVCINPDLHNNNDEGQDKDATTSHSKHQELIPIKTIELDVGVIAGEPFFATKNESNTTPTDSIESLVESEQASLQAAFDAATGEPKKIDDFLRLTQALAGKKNRIGRHMSLLMELESKLIVKTNVDGNYPETEKILFHFREHIFPLASKYKDSNVLYNISVMASQGLILAVATKNPEVSKVVFNELLGQGFDITKHKNRVLIYNLACYYAINNNKKDMLMAITQSRLRGTPKKQYLDDADFKKYISDPDFLKAIE